ncbi:ABC transporter ATP-binding protein [Subtercola sp. Z020]|uniref:ABC transporter ATP-binding protein n=1 Tax=Subtercola sp. Z020 TaxID=2080582 RepID=UPI00130E958A|nr:ABC transporter ATP-binding protein [Subtercola sp. Z020]
MSTLTPPAALPAPTDTTDSVLEVENLHVAYGSTQVVRDVSFRVRRAEKVGIVGESGSGKSTLALAIVGLLASNGSVSSGAVRVLGRDTVGLSDREFDRIRGRDLSLVFQDPLTSLDPVKTIGHQIAEVLKEHTPKISRARIRERSIELLNSVGVSDPASRLNQYPHEYSGGMRQRVLIAIAIANDPAVLIADEPTTALDVTTQAQVLEVLDSLVDRLGISVVLITHDLGVVSEFCDRVLVMYAGRVVESSPAASLFAHASHPYSLALLDSLPLPGRSRSEPLAWIPGAPPAMTDLPTGCSFSPRCTWAVDACSVVAPPKIMVGAADDHWSECHRAEEVAAAAPVAEAASAAPPESPAPAGDPAPPATPTDDRTPDASH